MKSRGQQHSCDGKVRYLSLKLASEAAGKLNDRGGRRVKSYKCNYCGSYHFGHESKGKKMAKAGKNIVPPFEYEPGVHRVSFNKRNI